ncbi:MAG: hypothetical protein PPP55_05095 [Halorubrum sp.]
MTGYYDYVLGLIPAALIGITAFLNLVGLSLQAALPVGAGVAAALMAHAMFVRGPMPDAGSSTPDLGSAPGRPPASNGSGGPAASSNSD